MALPTELNKADPQQGNGVTVDFDFGFRIDDAAHLFVIYTDADGIETTLDDSVYTVTGIGDDDGGTVTYPIGAGTPIATGTYITLVREVPIVQATNLRNQGGYFPETLEGTLDYIMMAVQQVAEAATRAVKVPVSSSTAPDDFIAELTQDVADAAASAAAALASQVAAAASAVAALASQVAAAASAALFPVIVATRYIRGNAGGTAWETRTAAQTIGDLSAVLTAVVAIFSSTGTVLAQQTALSLVPGTNVFIQRTLAQPAAGFTITNADGVSGAPTFALSDDLAAIEALSGTDTIYRRSAASTWSAVTIGSELSFASGTLRGSTVMQALQSVMSSTATVLGQQTALSLVPGTNVVAFNGAGGTPTSITLSNGTGLPISTGVSGLAANVAAFLATPSSANLAAMLTDETGSGANVHATSPTLVTPALGTPSSGTLTSCTGLPPTGLSLTTGTGNAVLSAGPTLTGTITAAAATFSSTVNVNNADFEIKGQQKQAFNVELNNVAGVIKHAISANGSGNTATNFAGRITGASNALATTPTGTDSSTAFGSGAKISTGDPHVLILNTAAQTVADLIFSVSMIVDASLLTDPVPNVQYRSYNVNGVTRLYACLSFTLATTGAAWNINTTNIPSGDYLQAFINAYFA